MKFKVGDIVKTKDELIDGRCYYGISLLKDMVTKRAIVVDICAKTKAVKLDNGYKYKEDMLEQINEYDIKKYFEEYIKCFKDYEIKIEVKKKEPVLDEEEKEYLSAVIRPFRNRVKNIMKRFSGNYEYICIFLKHIEKDFNEDICLPYFKANTMYKGMTWNKKYTLEELGL